MRATAGILLRTCWFQYRALFNWGTPIGYVSYKLLQPVAQILFFTELGTFATGPSTALYFALGNAMQLSAINGIFGVVQTVANERQFGTLPLLLGSPQNRLVVFFGRTLVHVVDGVVAVLVGLLIATVIFGLDLAHADLVGLAACVLLVPITTSGLGLMFGSVGLITRDVMVIGNIVYYMMLVICGVNFPVASLPGWLQVVAYSLPLTRGVEAARMAVAGVNFGALVPWLAGELAVGAVYGLVGFALFELLESRARRGGLQEAF